MRLHRSDVSEMDRCQEWRKLGVGTTRQRTPGRGGTQIHGPKEPQSDEIQSDWGNPTTNQSLQVSPTLHGIGRTKSTVNGEESEEL